MRWRRFFLLLTVGVVLSVCLACDQLAGTSDANTPVPAELPAMVQPSAGAPKSPANIAGTEGLYNPPRGEVRLMVISDLNSAYGSTDYEPEVDQGIRLASFWQPDMVLCSGDMVAGQDPSLSPAQIRAMWEAFDQHVAAPLRQAKLPYGFTIGNHDASGALSIGGTFLFQQERDLATEYWDNPKHDPGVQFVDRHEFPFYYSFEYKDIFFLAWDGSSNRIPSEKLDWVKQALASPKAQQAKMRILLGHLPLYAVSVGRNEPGETLDNADQLREILEQYNVHTYISGHDHAYYPAHKGDIQLLHTGILGSGPRPLLEGGLAPRKALTIVDVNFSSPDLTTYTTYDMQTLQLIQIEELPRFLTSHNGVIMRRDVKDLNATERRLCEQKLDSVLCAT
jgi:hypothetical protein